MIDNFELIKQTFCFTEEDNKFFHCQIIRRNKDQHGLENKTIKTYFIRSKEHLIKLESEIKTLCELFKARAYINIAPKSFVSLQNLLLLMLAERNFNNNISNPYKLLNSAAGTLKPEKARWIVDIDDLSKERIIKEKVNELLSVDLNNRLNPNYLHFDIPTKNGIHVITPPFNTKEFHKVFPTVDVHKNNPTLLYYPNSLDIT